MSITIQKQNGFEKKIQYNGDETGVKNQERTMLMEENIIAGQASA
jgi:hypothetical protein